MRFTSFDGTEHIEATLFRPDRYKALFQAINSNSAPISRGGGLSYCLGSVGAGGSVISTELFDRILSFDSETGLVTVESGITLGKLLTFAMTKGWHVPVLPGHPSITVGGSIGFNVHGKSQFQIGNFEKIVTRLWLYHPLHGEIECSRHKNSPVFKLTVGGMGLTGHITKAEIQLQKLPGKSIRVETVQVKNLEDAVETMKRLRERCSILYSWNNLNRRGKHFGSGTVYAEYFDSEGVPEIADFKPLHAPQGWKDRLGVWNSLSIPMMTTIYGIKEKIRPTVTHFGIKAGSFPISGKEIYFHFFGNIGFREYQLISPFETAGKLFNGVDALLSKYRLSASLGSLKLFEGNTEYLNYCKTGVCLSIDVPACARSLSLFSELDTLVGESGGIVNIAKDSRLSTETVSRLFPEYNKFKEDLHSFDPKKTFQSSLRTRLSL